MWIEGLSRTGGIPYMLEKNRSEIIHDALNQLDDDLIEEVDAIRKSAVNTRDERSTRKKTWRHITTIAASIAIFFIAGFVWSEVIVPNTVNTEEGFVEESAMEDAHKTDENKDEIIEEIDDLNAVNETDEIAKSESQMLQQSQEQIHLPNQEIEKVAGVESLTGIEIPAWDVELGREEDGISADMLAFFIYEGRCYVQNEYYEEGFSLVGDYVGTSVGMIDEWTQEDGYVDYAGSVEGAFYEVKGYDTSFMLCMKYEDGAVETFINNNGIVLGKGSDLIQNRLHLKDNFEKVTFKTQQEWNETLRDEKNHVLPEEYNDLMERFLKAYSSDDFVYIKDTPLDVSGAGRYHENTNNYHLTFHTKDGLRFDFVLYEDGYVRFHGFNEVCVQIDPKLYEEIIEVLENES